MELGIDPKNDFAFKTVFGVEQRTQLLAHLLNAVLNLPPGERIIEVEILNPISELVVLNEKTLILDVRARDQLGRQFIIEMQMIAHPSQRGRFLYYWAKTYSTQLPAGTDYDWLNPVVSICFIDGLLFPESDAYHLQFQLREVTTGLPMTDQMAIHVFQLPNFTKSASELRDPLDLWLYFLNNGAHLDPQNLPPALRVPEVEEAMSVLTQLSQDEVREHYEAREKARRDARIWIRSLEKTRAEVAAAQAEAATAKAEAATAKADAATAKAEAATAKADAATAKADAATAKADAATAKADAATALIDQIRLCEWMLKQPPRPDEHLKALTPDELQSLVRQLRGQLPRD
jgi:predicted transposase/invertase (TIGR01784 family)